MRSRLLLRLGLLGLSLVALSLGATEARAEADGFGLGDGHSGAKTVAGDEVVNAYAGITADVAAGANTIAVSNVIGTGTFAAGDLVLVWRTTGAAATEAPSGNQTKRLDLVTTLATQGAGTAAGLVGTYEFARVQSVALPTITLTKPLLRGYTRFVSQVVRVPEYTTVNVPAGTSILPTAWQEVGGTPAAPNPDAPWAGGIAIFLATGAITNNGLIHANGRGFHGGVPVQRAINPVGLVCDQASLDGNSSTGAFAPKGQGVVHARYAAAIGGRGNVSMAGGGGNCVEAGGGGGANQGNGGIGSGTALNLGSGGLGGIGVDYDVLTRLTLGGGGGSGRHTVGILSEVSLGGFGGGVVYIRGASMAGSGNLRATGGNGENSGIANLPVGVASEGSGGGGAGGTIVVRLTGTLDCDTLASAGGNGGSAVVAGLPVFGAGGGGGGGRVYYQTTDKAAGCDVIVAPGSPGNNGQGGSQPGGPGGTQDPPTTGFCFGTPGTTGCTDPTPVCENGECKACTGPFGGGTPQACAEKLKPVCKTSGACSPCNGDFQSGADNACQLGGSPHCFTSGGVDLVGSCGKCTADADCAGEDHAGPVCNPLAGICGLACTKDEDCKPTEWCAPKGSGANVCIPKTPNGESVPSFPPIDGECTAAKGKRVCLSSVCEEVDDKCGKKNGSPCSGATECRSNICFDKDDLCGKPTGEPCGGNGECRSELCKDGVCTGCQEDTDCAGGLVCDTREPGGKCIEGCRPGAVAPADGGAAHGVCPPGKVCLVADGGSIGTCQDPPDGGAAGDGGTNADAGDTSGIIEGGGCSCNTTPATASPIALGLATFGLLAFARRRQKRSRSTTPNDDAS